MASEAVEAGLTWHKSSALMIRGYMQSFDLIALKLRLLPLLKSPLDLILILILSLKSQDLTLFNIGTP